MKTCMQFLALFVLAIYVGGSTIGGGAEPAASPGQADHQDLSYYLQTSGRRAAVRTPADWRKRRRQIVAGMEEVMGPLPRPAVPVPLAIEVIEEHREDGILRRKLAYHTDRHDQHVRAWLIMPADSSAATRPGVLCLHQTTPRGKDSPAGLSDRPSMHIALELARRGFVTLSPDYPSFGEYSHDFDTDEYDSGSMKAIYDNRRAIDVMQSLPEVDVNHIGCIGHSLGGHNALFTAVFDERIKAVVTSCGFTRFHKYMGGDLAGWSGPRYMPRITSAYGLSPDQMPFDFTEVLAAVAPRPMFIVAPLHDDNFAVDGVRDVVSAAKPVYRLLGQPGRMRVVYPDGDHDFTSSARQQAYAFLDEFLRPVR